MLKYALCSIYTRNYVKKLQEIREFIYILPMRIYIYYKFRKYSASACKSHSVKYAPGRWKQTFQVFII